MKITPTNRLLALMAPFVAAASGAAIAAACSINPQPLPPDAPDGSAEDAGATFNAGSAADAANAPTANLGDDGGASGGDTSDAGAESEGGASDAATDAANAGDAGH